MARHAKVGRVSVTEDVPRGRTSSAIRAANQSAIVDVLRRHGRATRAQLCELTGLSRATVSALVGELSARGLVVEQPTGHSPAGGRPAGVLTLDRSGGLGIGIDIGVRHLAVAVGDLSRTVHAERWWPEPAGHSAPDGLALVLESVATALREARAERERIIGAAVSIAAPIDATDGTIAEPRVLPGWTAARLADALARELRVPVTIHNDATLGALGEKIWGSRAGARNLAYIKLASRVGAGLVVNGAVYRGSTGLAGEFGHLTVDPDGPTCWCGSRGCLELYAGGGALLRSLPGHDDDRGGLESMIDAALDGDPDVVRAVRTSATHLGRGVAALVNLLDPEHVVIGGELSRLGDLLLDPVRAELAQHSFVARSGELTVSISSLGHRASLLGALALVLTEPSRLGGGTHPRTEGVR